MTIEKRVTGEGPRWKAREGGRSVTSRTLKDAKEWAAKTYLESQDGQQPTYGGLNEVWHGYIEINRSRAYSDTQGRIHTRCSSHFDSWPWYEVTKSAVLTYLDSLPMSNNSRNTVIGNITTCFSHFVRRDVLPYNPLDKIPKYGHEPAKPYTPPVEDMTKLLAHIGRSQRADRLLVDDVCLETGCRIGEIVDTKLRPSDKWLRWVDCRLQQDPPLLRLWTKKSGKSSWIEADMPISSGLAARLMEWKLQGMHDGEHVFPWSYSALKRWLKQCCIEAKIKPFGWHSFRHFFAHYLASQDISDKSIQLALRHKNITMTQRYLQSLKPSHDLVKHTFKRDLSSEGPKRVKGGES
jgi:integrase